MVFNIDSQQFHKDTEVFLRSYLALPNILDSSIIVYTLQRYALSIKSDPSLTNLVATTMPRLGDRTSRKHANSAKGFGRNSNNLCGNLHQTMSRGFKIEADETEGTRSISVELGPSSPE